MCPSAALIRGDHGQRRAPWCVIALAVVALLLFIRPGWASPRPPDLSLEPVFDSDAAYLLSQAAVGRQLGDYQFTAADGRPVRLSDFRGKPVVLSLVYSSCYQICSMTTRSLAKAVKTARSVLGDDSFVVLSVGFDTPVDTPEAMRAFAEKQGVHVEGWYFLSGDAATLAALTRDAGFTFQPSPKGFDHLLQTTILDGEGRIYKQIYGEMFEPPWVVEPLKQLVFGTSPDDSALTQVVNKVRMFCVAYDPATGTYRYDYSLFIGIAIGLTIIGAASGFLLHGVRRHRSV